MVTTKLRSNAAVVLTLLLWTCPNLNSQTTEPDHSAPFETLASKDSGPAAGSFSPSDQSRSAPRPVSPPPLVMQDASPSRRFGMAMISVPVPGLGLALDRHPWWGLAALAGTVGGGYWIYYQYGAEDAAYKQYLSAQTPTDAQNAWNNDRLQNNLFVTAQIVTGVIYATQVIAAAAVAPRRLGKPRQPKLQLPNLEEGHLVVGPLCAAYQVPW